MFLTPIFVTKCYYAELNKKCNTIKMVNLMVILGYN